MIWGADNKHSIAAHEDTNKEHDNETGNVLHDFNKESHKLS